MNAGRAGLLAAMLLGVAAPALAEKPRLEHVYGPAPDWEQYRQMAEAAIVAQLIDPESARITWAGGYFKGEFKPFISPRIGGYVGCGTVNARNRMGGYAGASNFAVVIDYDRVLHVEMDGRSPGLAWNQCNQALKAGLIPPLDSWKTEAVATASTSTPSSTNTGSGLSLRAMSEGAYVSAVRPDSPAAVAGAKPGMLITRVNAIPLEGMGEAMLKMVDAAGQDATLEIVGGRTIKLGGHP